MQLLDSTGTDALDPARTETAQSATASGHQSTWSAGYYGNSAHLSAGGAQIYVRLKG